MKPILQNLVEMTGHRDHLRLEVSVLSTLQSLSSIVQVRSLEVFTRDGELFMRPRTWMDNGQWMSAESEAATDPQAQAIAQIPALHECIESRAAHAIAMLGKGRHCMWLPVWMQDKVTTCLEVIQSRPFSSQKIDIITSVFHVYKNYQSLLDYSERDALTGLFNRKTFDEQFSRFTSPEASERQPIPSDSETIDDAAHQWLAVVDIDHFKQVNDRFGHLYGDEVLILVANILRSSFRSHDRIFRFGGEEFVVLLRSTSLSTAHKVFNRFRKNVEDYYFPQVGQVTVSVGFVSTANGSPVEILGQADQALYFAKENGRNQVRFYDDLVAEGHLQAKVSNDDVELF
ncbi:GGDEF domain-containing protein [Simplicispira lacusdiani]|uniref:GGDEF domain-containing protein n=1 Tax=Simplicispira lacusdiani TaxID=2213010 RepID=UPI000E71445C|nr:GGDEF domain-containing protein [Simplicispira lacusdiani]